MRLFTRHRLTEKSVLACSSPEELGELLWAALGTAVNPDLFDLALTKASSMTSFHSTRLRYPWNALVALAPDLAALKKCLKLGPVGFEPLFEPSDVPSHVFGDDAAWRTAFSLAFSFRAASSPARISTAWASAVGNSALSYMHTVVLTNAGIALLCEALADSLMTYTPTMSWGDLCSRINSVSNHPAQDVTWLGALTEELANLGETGVHIDAVATACVQVWRALITDDNALENARALRRAGAVGTIGELMTAATVVNL